MSIKTMIHEIAASAKEASRHLRTVNRQGKDASLESIAKKLIERKNEIQTENKKDLDTAKEKG